MVPATLGTCSARGVPNVSYISAIQRVDDCHLALSYQFFSKSRSNIEENPYAQVLMIEPQSFQQVRVSLRYRRTDTDGPVFDGMKTHLDAIASQTGMEAVFRLRGADVYEVLDVELLPCDLDLAPFESREHDHRSRGLRISTSSWQQLWKA
jgi:predicted pyridoxine 5'-phosphate oxidase superfamily flavin-nucleotide-binding protein